MTGHKRVVAKRGRPQTCELCNTTDATRYEWANLTGDYLNVDDYKRMCQPCHIKFDGSANKGTTNPMHKLTEEQVREIRRRYVKGQRGPNSTVGLSKEFGVHQRKIWEIVNGKAWKHVI